MHLKDMLAALKSVFGLSFMEHVVIGFTRWDYSHRGAVLRRGVTEKVRRHPDWLLSEPALLRVPYFASLGVAFAGAGRVCQCLAAGSPWAPPRLRMHLPGQHAPHVWRRRAP